MTVERAIELFDVREKQSLAFCDIYKEKLDYDNLQVAIDNYCNNMAESFIEAHSQFFANEDARIQLQRYLHSIGADKPHSGKRFHEAMYNQISNIKDKNADELAEDTNLEKSV